MKILPISLRIFLPLLCLSCSVKNQQYQETTNPDSIAGKTVYHNPVDGKSYASDSWKKYSPEKGTQEVQGKTRLKQVVLLSTQNQIARAISVDQLSTYMKESQKVVLKELSTVKETGELLVQFSLYHNQSPAIRLAMSTNLQSLDFTPLYNHLQTASEKYRTTQDSCSYQLHFEVNTQ